MSFDFVACQTYAGGFDLGMTQAGGRLIHKVEQTGGFGLQNCLVNRHLLGDAWDSQACEPDEWEVMQSETAVVIANPPCS